MFAVLQLPQNPIRNRQGLEKLAYHVSQQKCHLKIWTKMMGLRVNSCMVHAIQLFTTCNIGIYGGEWVAQGNAAYHAILHILKRWIYNLLRSQKNCHDDSW